MHISPEPTAKTQQTVFRKNTTNQQWELPPPPPPPFFQSTDQPGEQSTDQPGEPNILGFGIKTIEQELV